MFAVLGDCGGYTYIVAYVLFVFFCERLKKAIFHSFLTTSATMNAVSATKKYTARRQSPMKQEAMLELAVEPSAE